ncbi:MAG: hypothetical protein WCG06_00575 [Candidatus Omnitrophota bacterium]
MSRDFTTMTRDFIATHMRSQMDRMKNVLEHLEGEKPDGSYMAMSLRDLETNLRRIRKVCETV